ncbi:MAG: peptidoglycan-binding domain-containing protein [Cyanobacteria bacterium P01_A01_bin.135]
MGLGHNGDAVASLQSVLATLGDYHGPIDGRYGAETATAVAQLQSRYGLETTGSYDADTWYALNFWLPEEQGWPAEGALTSPRFLGTLSRTLRGWLAPARA